MHFSLAEMHIFIYVHLNNSANDGLHAPWHAPFALHFLSLAPRFQRFSRVLARAHQFHSHCCICNCRHIGRRRSDQANLSFIKSHIFKCNGNSSRKNQKKKNRLEIYNNDMNIIMDTCRQWLLKTNSVNSGEPRHQSLHANEWNW